MGFDYGTKRIGVAVGQTLMATARPVAVVPVKNQHPDWQQINVLINEWQPETLIVGLPCHADGSENAMTLAVRQFTKQLDERYQLPIYTIDERLSSIAAAEHKVKELREKKGNKNNKVVKFSASSFSSPIDAIAAQIILETWFVELIHKSP